MPAPSRPIHYTSGPLTGLRRFRKQFWTGLLVLQVEEAIEGKVYTGPKMLPETYRYKTIWRDAVEWDLRMLDYMDQRAAEKAASL